MDEVVVVSVNEDGLGNRMKCWVNSLALDVNAKLYWPINKTIDCRFLDLFEDNGKLIDNIPENAKLMSNWRLTAFPRELLPENFASYRGHSYSDGRAIDFEYERVPYEIKEIFLPLFQSIVPRPEVVTAIESVACDSPDELRKFERQYPDRVISCTANGTTSEDKFQHALTEMYLLSKNKTLITSYASTFSEVAWWLGGANADVSIVPNKEMDLPVDETKGIRFFIFKIKRKLKQLINFRIGSKT